MNSRDFQRKLLRSEKRVSQTPSLWKTGLYLLFTLAIIFSIAGCQGQDTYSPSASSTISVAASTEKPIPKGDPGKEQGQQNASKEAVTATKEETALSEDGIYTSKEEVALYLHLYKHLPSNYITKKEAMDLGWENSKGNLDKVAPGKSIGGDRFGNREGFLPNKKGRTWKECDIGYDGGYRGGERIVFSSDGEIYYSKDHYKNFELLYGTGK